MEFFKPGRVIDFMKYRGRVIPFSLALAVVSIILAFAPGPNYGIDFKGGTELQLLFEEDVKPAALRGSLSELGYSAEVVSVEGSSREYMIRVSDVTSLPPEKLQAIEKSLAGSVDGVEVESIKVSPGGDKLTLRMKGEVQESSLETALKTAGAEVRSVNRFGPRAQNRYEAHLVGVADEMLKGLRDKMGAAVPDNPRRVEWVGPKAGAQLRDAAVKSMLWAILFIMLYVALRFDLRFAPGGVVAMVHDALITVGIFVVMQREVNLATVAALLTILGYSINDTIVVYDRIRENMQRMRDVTLYRLINISTSQTLSRTILTGVTTILSIAAFFFWGTPVIRDFAFALLIGVLIGTYSSIYIAAPLTEWMDRKFFTKA